MLVYRYQNPAGYVTVTDYCITDSKLSKQTGNIIEHAMITT